MRTLTLAVVGLGLVACMDTRAPIAGPDLAINVAALSLPGVTDVCFGVTVKDGTGVNAATVWSESGLCASRFGDGAGGDLTYIGTCDASPDGRVNVVELTLESIATTGGGPLDATSYRNPCPAGAPCRLEAACHANGDTAVTFDLTIARDANQGFFDVAVEFEDVFCSAKLDCKPSLLLDGDGARRETAVVGFACTSGGDTTNLYLDDIVVTCGGNERFRIDPAAGVGNLGARAGSYQAAIYAGSEAFPDHDTCYWNAAVGLDLAALPGSCTLTLRGTASETPLAAVSGGFTTPSGAVYPVIEWTVPLSTNGVMTCGANPLDGAGSGVTTEYSTPSGAVLAHHRACGEAPVSGENHAPVGTAVPVTVVEGTQLQLPPSWFFTDPDDDAMTFELNGNPPWITYENGLVTFAPPVGDLEIMSPFMVYLTANDGHVSVDLLFPVTVSSPVDEPPVTTGNSAWVREGDDFTTPVSDFFYDPNGDAFTVGYTGSLGWFSIGGGSVSLSPGLDDAGDYDVPVTVTDNVGVERAAIIRVHVENLNVAPVAIGEDSEDFSVSEGEHFSQGIASFFSDPDNDPLTFEVMPTAGDFYGTVIAGASTATRVNPIGFTGSDRIGTFTVRATDPGGLSVTRQFTVHIANTNRAPTLVIGSPTMLFLSEEAARGPLVYLYEAFQDLDIPDGDSLEYELDSNTHFYASGGILYHWGETIAAGAAHTVTVTATDSEGLAVSLQVTVRIL